MCLKKTGVRFELLTNPDMLLMFERRIRGGIPQAIHQYTKTSKKYMRNPKRISSFLQYLDADNLYGWAMSQKLPTRGFNRVDDVHTFTPTMLSSLAKNFN